MGYNVGNGNVYLFAQVYYDSLLREVKEEVLLNLILYCDGHSTHLLSFTLYKLYAIFIEMGLIKVVEYNYL